MRRTERENGNRACYFENKAYFTKKGLNKETVLHETYHHLVHINVIEIPHRNEEREADKYARSFPKIGR